MAIVVFSNTECIGDWIDYIVLLAVGSICTDAKKAAACGFILIVSKKSTSGKLVPISHPQHSYLQLLSNKKAWILLYGVR